jgi:hypothetical protein
MPGISVNGSLNHALVVVVVRLVNMEGMRT